MHMCKIASVKRMV